MNEHDSERIAGLLEADGLRAGGTDRRCRRRRAQHLLHPGERRQQALRHARPPQVRSRTPGPDLRDHGRRLPGPEGPRPRSGRGPATSTSCSAPTTCTGPSSCSTRPGPPARWSRSGTRPLARGPRPSPRRCRRAVRSTLGVGDHPDRVRQRLCVLHRAGRARREISRPFGDSSTEVERLAADGVTEVTLLGQNVNSYGRDLTTACAERRRLARRRHRRRAGLGRRPGSAAPTAVRRPARGRRPRSRASSGCATRRPHPKDLRPETIAAMAAHRRGVSAPAPAAAVGQRPDPRRHAPGLHRRALPRAAGRRPASAIDDLAVTTDIIVGFPGETDADFAQHPRGRGRCRLRQRLHLHLLTPAGTEAAELVDRFVAPEVVAERFERLRAVVERSALASIGPGSGGPRRSSSRARQARPRGPHGAHRPEQARALRCRRPRCGRELRASVARHRRRSALPAWRAGRGDGRASAPHPHPRHRRLT